MRNIRSKRLTAYSSLDALSYLSDAMEHSSELGKALRKAYMNARFTKNTEAANAILKATVILDDLDKRIADASEACKYDVLHTKY